MTLLLGGLGAAFGSLAGGVTVLQGLNLGVLAAMLLFPEKGPTLETGKLSDLKITVSEPGQPIPYVFGRYALGTNVIWGTDLVESAGSSGGGGKKGKGASTIAYTYYANFATLVCKGPMARVRRVWFDGDVVYDDRPDVAGYRGPWFHESLVAENVRIYSDGKLWDGSAFSGSVVADSLIQADKGVDRTPAFVGRTYIVFEGLNVNYFGRHIPQIKVEVESSSGTISTQNFTGVVPADFALTGNAVSGSVNAYNHIEVVMSGTPGATTVEVDLEPGIGNRNYSASGPDGLVRHFEFNFHAGGMRLSTAGWALRFQNDDGSPVSFTPTTLAITENGNATNGYIYRAVANFATGTDAQWDNIKKIRWSFTVSSGDIATVPDVLTIYPYVVGDPSDTTTLEGVMESLADAVEIGSGNYDFSALSTITVRGFACTQDVEVRDYISKLSMIYKFDLVSYDGQLKAVVRGGALQDPIDELHMGANTTGGDVPTYALSVLDEVQIPRSLQLGYQSERSGFQEWFQLAHREYGDSVKPSTVRMPAVLDDDEAAALALVWVTVGGIGKTSCKVDLPLRYLQFAPGDLVPIPLNTGYNITLRIEEMTVNLIGQVELVGKEDDPAAYTQTAVGSASPTDDSGTDLRKVFVAMVDTAAINDLQVAQEESGGWEGTLVVFGGGPGDPFPGAVAHANIYNAITSDFYSNNPLLGKVDTRASYGKTTTVLGSGVTHIFDDVNTVDVVFTNGAPTTATDLAVLNGANMILIGQELLQFANVTALGGTKYQLGRLLRGRRGTSWAMGSHAVDEDVALIDSAVESWHILTQGGPVIDWHYHSWLTNAGGPDDVQGVDITFARNSRKPYPVVHLTLDSGEFQVSDLVFSWVRQARKQNGLADLSDVPLDEVSEQYRVRIYEGSTLTREDTVTSPTWTYDLADQTADFPVDPIADLTLQVVQMGVNGSLAGHAVTYTIFEV